MKFTENEESVITDHVSAALSTYVEIKAEEENKSKKDVVKELFNSVYPDAFYRGFVCGIVAVSNFPEIAEISKNHANEKIEN